MAWRYGAYELRQKVRRRTYRRLKVGDRVRVRFLPNDPRVARLQDER